MLNLFATKLPCGIFSASLNLCKFPFIYVAFSTLTCAHVKPPWVDFINFFTLCAKLCVLRLAFVRRKSLAQSVNRFMKFTH